ncbi:MAG: arsenical resistance operon transcriptional repressor ArsD [Elusimicrobia bacterium CG1_02_63_36]|nr:MAG: arsenical resistance operon transcriptional repressor ArsD [Elusimicrobia bacterium CG1_02_63_36]PIP81774.1 MAG: arsenical resistance operon transcriptional repressor ArsD [Elusimicrobia bacterium CG22_combo_CG10-13_8_21_14_all_63_91]PJA14783.1 MAG: arsenical resistance operon transcriptional repressor ArsD [Elusimicrobia bacterium CG_4_10_14_0_2_um_filter_63_34]PJB25550.1 MAG: arsenical resistance operon transcriptional repressor ArsD [Elusimicrobia bacterium CG_4_9_14_3_um_filter_62_55
MKTMTVYDPAMCCSTGVCGPSVDPALARFGGDLDWLAGKGVSVTRYNLAQEPGAFAAAPAVSKALEEKGTECLPIVVVDGAVVSEGKYPSRGQLARWTGTAMELPVQSAPSSCCDPKDGGSCC